MSLSVRQFPYYGKTWLVCGRREQIINWAQARLRDKKKKEFVTAQLFFSPR
jgi:hypothetical protein